MMGLNLKVIKALLKRDLKLYFSNPTGYVFVTLFIFLSAAAAFWQDRFFMNNLANLDQLNYLFPYLLMFFVPAITMGVWADERKQGTDELLLTLPASDVEIVLGKYLSTLGIYTAALLLSLSHLAVLSWLGSPDLGLMVSNYIGYWLIGAAFIAVGMVASMLSPNVTVAFVLGGLFCAFFVYVTRIMGIFGEGVERAVEPVAVFQHFRDFARGVVSFSGLLYFLSLIAVMLYMNTILIGRRHWPQMADGWKMWIHHTLRLVAVVIGVLALNVLFARTTLRLDFTAERLHSLSDQTRAIIEDLPDDRPVFVQAFLSRDVPEAYVQTRETLVGFLREIDAIAGNRVEVIIRDTEPFSDDARDAREKFNILPIQLPAIGARAQISNIFLGLAFTCGAEESVIPFFERGLPVEYEIARGIRVVARVERKKVGVLNTELKLFGGFDFNTFQSQPPWPVVEELRKQYEVVQIAATDSITEDLDALLVALPSALPQPEMDNLLAYINAGNPTMLLIDPLPVMNIGLSPSEKAGGNKNPFQRGGPPPTDKGNIDAFMNALGVRWNKTQIVWDSYNPHPDMANLPPEIVFIGRGNENPQTFNDDYAASADLQEMVLLFPGTITPIGGAEAGFEAILRSGRVAGSNGYAQYVQRSFLGSQLVIGQAPHYPSQSDYPLAARINTEGDGGLDVVIVADVDFISDQFFQIRNRGVENLNFDNISFFLNCIDVLAGDDSFVDLRKRRVKHRTLETVEARVRAYSERRSVEQREAEAEAQAALNDAQRRLNEKVAVVQQRADLDSQTKQIMARNLQEVENRRFEALKANINAERDAKIERSKEDMESQIRVIHSNIKTLAGLGPPIPVFVLGIMVFMRRRNREREGAAAARRLKG